MSMGEASQNQDDISKSRYCRFVVRCFLQMILWGFPLTDVAKITDEVYMEVVVGSEDPGNAQQTIDNASLSKDFMPVAWAAAYS